MAKERKIEIRVKEFETKGEEKIKFLSFKGMTKKGWLNLKFKKSVDQNLIPTKNCIIVVDEDKMNIQTSSQYPTIWVDEIKRVEEIVYSSHVEDYFDK